MLTKTKDFNILNIFLVQKKLKSNKLTFKTLMLCRVL